MKSEVKESVLVVYLDENILGYSDVDQTMEWMKGYFRTGIKHVVINMKGVAFLNSSGLGKLVQWVTKFRIAGGKIVFCNLSEHIQKLVGLTRLEQVFEVFADETAAISYLNNLGKK